MLEVLLFIGIYIALIAIDAWVVVWNVQAIIDHGFSFWPVFWLLGVAISILPTRGTSKD